nr:phosphoribosylglycinamide formyltransferase [uncultured Niameybacter sp.]
MGGLRIAVLASGSGTNLQSIIDGIEEGILQSKIVSVISNKENAFALERAKVHGIPFYYMDSKLEDYDMKLLGRLKEDEVDLIVLAGYLKIISSEMIRTYRERIINIHPSLLPKFGGKGYYGIKVHEAVLKSGEAYSGATVHFVDEGVDTGEIILQETVSVYSTDTPEVLQKRVLCEVEHKILVQAIKKLEEERG